VTFFKIRESFGRKKSIRSTTCKQASEELKHPKEVTGGAKPT
jgi:hypothetical protein